MRQIAQVLCHAHRKIGRRVLEFDHAVALYHAGHWFVLLCNVVACLLVGFRSPVLLLLVGMHANIEGTPFLHTFIYNMGLCIDETLMYWKILLTFAYSDGIQDRYAFCVSVPCLFVFLPDSHACIASVSVAWLICTTSSTGCAPSRVLDA